MKPLKIDSDYKEFEIFQGEFHAHFESLTERDLGSCGEDLFLSEVKLLKTLKDKSFRSLESQMRPGAFDRFAAAVFKFAKVFFFIIFFPISVPCFIVLKIKKIIKRMIKTRKAKKLTAAAGTAANTAAAAVAIKVEPVSPTAAAGEAEPAADAVSGGEEADPAEDTTPPISED